MRFAKQKFLIALLLLAIPFFTFFAVVQTPEVSGYLLTVALKFARFRTGLRFEASTWSVSPLAFSASIQNLSVGIEKIQITAPEVSVQLSPLSLLFGDIHLNQISVQNAKLGGRWPDEWRKSDPDAEKIDWATVDLPSLVGSRLARISETLAKRRISFSELSLRNFSLDLKEAKISHGNLEVANLESGQARLDFSFDDLQVFDRVAQLKNISTSLALIKETRSQYYLAIRSVHVEWAAEKNLASEINVSGRWPGESSVDADLDLKRLNNWLTASPALKKFALNTFVDGHFKTGIKVKTLRNKLAELSGNATLTGFKIKDYFPNNVQFSFAGDGSNWQVPRLELQLPKTRSDLTAWKRNVVVTDVKLQDRKLSGTADFQDTSLCSILLAASVPECFVTIPISGKAEFSGGIDPMELVAKADLHVGNGTVYTEPLSASLKDNTLLHFTEGRVQGEVAIHEKDVDIRNASVVWKDGSSLHAKGNVIIRPILVNLAIEGNDVDLAVVVKDFLDLPLLGKLTADSKITYSEIIPHDDGRVKVEANASVDGMGLVGQIFGGVKGPVNYESNNLLIGPLKLRNGGGVASIEGAIKNRDHRGSYLEVGADLDRLELSTKSADTGNEFLHGFVSGRAKIHGFTDPAKDGGLSGPLDLQVDTLKAFGIPFQSATVKAQYEKRILYLQKVIGKKGKATVELAGELNPEPGTELHFKSDAVRIADIGFFPKLEERFQNGLIRIDGFWRPASGWEVLGRLSQVRIAERPLPDGVLKLSGAGNDFEMHANLGSDLQVQFKADTGGKVMEPVLMKATAREAGIYAAFAYLREWTSGYPLTTRGQVDLDWTPDRGLLRLHDMEIDGPQGSDAKISSLLRAPGVHEFAWNGNAIAKNELAFGGPASFKVTGEPGDHLAKFQVNLPLALVDLFMPSNARLMEGKTELTGTLTLPLNLAKVQAQGTVKNGALQLKGLGQPMTNLNGKFEFNDERFVISDTSGTLGNGTVDLSGLYKLDLNHPAVQLNIHLNRARVIVMDDVPMEMNGDLTLKGENFPYLLTGKVQIISGLYSKEFAEENSTLLSGVTKPVLKFAIDVDIGQNFMAKNTFASTQVTGRLSVGGNDLKPLVQGTLELTKGSIFAKDTEFKILQGRMSFAGNPNLPPTLNLQASTVVKYLAQSYKIDLNAHGPVNGLSIEFVSDPSLPTQDIVNLLAFGVLRSNEDVTTTQTTDYSDAIRAQALQTLFGSAIGPTLYKNTGIQVRVSAQPDIAQTQTVTKVTVGRKLSDRMTATVGRTIDPGKSEKNVQVDYRLLNNVNLSGVYDVPQTQDPSAGFDLRFRFDIK